MRYRFIPLLLIPLAFSGASFSRPQKINQPQLESVSIHSIHDAIQNHQMTCFDLVAAYIERIKKYNLSARSAAPINAWTELNPSVLVEAQQLDAAFKQSGKLTGALHCIPVILKDNIDSFDTTTTSGSYALLGSQPVRDAFLVSNLRKAGAIILGKGGMDEFAWGMIGISSRSGRMGNAFNPNKNPGGSSGGPAAAVSASFAVLGIGTDNSGSVRIPAAFHGLVGLRPSTGLISQQGIFPMGNLDGTAGPIAKSTEELALVLDIIAKPDPQDPKTLDIPRIESYKQFLNRNGLMNKRIGIVHNVNGIKPFENMPGRILKIVQSATQDMHKMGATFIDIDLPLFNNDRKITRQGSFRMSMHTWLPFPQPGKIFRIFVNLIAREILEPIKNVFAFSRTWQTRAARPIKKQNRYLPKIKSMSTGL